MSYANKEVLEFYANLPFNIYGSLEKQIESVIANNVAREYPILEPFLKPRKNLLDVGCGAGRIANSTAYHHHMEVTGIDFNSVAIDTARKTAKALGINTKFIVQDLFAFEPDELFDLVTSIGVLHHTNNCLEGVRKICHDFVKPGGYVFIGLYHSYGRRPFLNFFKTLKSQGASKEELFQHYRKLHSNLSDEIHLESWFRDQVLNPHETQHTLEEIWEVLHKNNMQLLRTSLNRFEKIKNLEKIFQNEKKMESVGEERLRQGKYFPGFFVFLAQKK